MRRNMVVQHGEYRAEIGFDENNRAVIQSNIGRLFPYGENDADNITHQQVRGAQILAKMMLDMTNAAKSDVEAALWYAMEVILPWPK